MKANTKYIANDGYENFMCPMTEFKVTQGEDVGTHKGTRAVDFASGTAGYRAPYYAPATVKCIAAYPSSGQGIWQTVNKVHCPNGYFGIVTFCTVHDDTFNAYVGMVVPQGSQLGNMGTKGYATGVHLHIEFIQSSYPGWVQNSYGVWTFNGTESFVDDTFYIDDTNVIYGGAGNWRKVTTHSSGYNDSQLIAEIGRATFRNDVRISVRKNNPTGEVVSYKNKGDVQDYSWKWIGNGHRYIVWTEGPNKLFCAVSGTEERPAEGSDDQWATFGSVEDDTSDPVDYTKNVKGYGVDISEHNGENFDVSKYDFVIIRASYGTNKDKLFDTYAKKCEEANIPYGVYCYSYALDNEGAKAEGEFILDLIKDKDIALGVWYDMEDADGYKAKNNALTKDKLTSFCKIFCDVVHSQGYYTGVYSTKHWFETLCPTDYPKWVANWGTNDGNVQADFSDYAVMHQYSANPIDKDIIFYDIEFYESTPIKQGQNEPQETVEGTKEQVDVKQVNSLISLLIKLIEKILGIFK